jgi:AraC family transcriptional regulator
MVSFALRDREKCDPGSLKTWPEKLSFAPPILRSVSDIRRFTGFSTDAPSILDDVAYLARSNLQVAQASGLRLVPSFMRSGEAEPQIARGGLAPWQARKVDQYLREHLEHPVRSDELAELVELSASYFSHAFKKTFGVTPHTYIIRRRLELAQKLMLYTHDSLSQIALAIGLSDQSHLCRLFRRGVGETPDAWRRRNLSDAQAESRSLRRRDAIRHEANI